MFGEILKVGDRVVIDIPDENWKWGYKPVPQQRGCVGIVTGFGEMEVHRICEFGREPGVYIDQGSVLVDVDGVSIMMSAYHLTLEDIHEYENRMDKVSIHEFRNNQKPIRQLPETKLWEYDIVSVKPEKIEHLSDIIKGRDLYISYIRYPAMEQKACDGSPIPFYDVAFSGMKGMLTSMGDEDLTLVKRGNVWKYYHKEPLEFPNFEEEVDFFHKMGHYKEIQNPRTGSFLWELKEVLEAIKRGEVDGLKGSTGVHGVYAYKMIDRELGERLKAVTLEGFNGMKFCSRAGCFNEAKYKFTAEGKIAYTCGCHGIGKLFNGYGNQEEGNE